MGRFWFEWIVSSPDLKAFTFPPRALAYVHRIAIQFSNGLLMKNENRSLYLNSLPLTC